MPLIHPTRIATTAAASAVTVGIERERSEDAPILYELLAQERVHRPQVIRLAERVDPQLPICIDFYRLLEG